MPATATYGPDELLTRATATVHRLPLERVRPRQHILAVTFCSPQGRRWDAVGGAETIAAAIESARECCPDDTAWDVENWNDLYGD